MDPTEDMYLQPGPQDGLSVGLGACDEEGVAMLELMAETGGNVLAVRARGVLTEDDYQDVLVPHLEKALEAGERVRVLFLLDEAFQGWTTRAAWLNTRLDLRHRRDFDKVAIVGAPTWENWCAKLANLLVSGQIKAFARGELATARAWLRA